MERLICLAIGYVFGLIQTGFIYGKLHHIDIREHGSGNAGSTNALRTLGKKAGVITFLGDSLKCVAAIAITRFFFQNTYQETLPLLCMYTGVGTVLGHNFPFYLKFKGGKGIATTVGLALAIDWKVAIVACAIFVVVVAVTKYVSVGSIVLISVFAIGIIMNGVYGIFLMNTENMYELYALVTFLVVLAVYRHKLNIQRLMSGTENKIGAKKREASNG